MSDLRIRLLTHADLPAYKSLRDLGLRTDPDAFGVDYETASQRPPASYAARLGQPPNDDFMLGAFNPIDELIGSLVCVRSTGPKQRHEASLFGMIVAPEARRQGVGLGMLTAFDALVRQIPGVEQVVLTVTASNTGAVHLYERAGFSRYGFLPRAMKVGDRYVDSALMLKVL